jgi:hypothetical protein
VSRQLTLGQKQKIQRDMCAATVRQMKGLMEFAVRRTLKRDLLEMSTQTVAGLEFLAQQIEQGALSLERVEFLTWILGPKSDLDSMVKPSGPSLFFDPNRDTLPASENWQEPSI